MIRFLGKTKEGDERVAVVDHSRRKEGEIEFTVRAMRDDELCFNYFNRIMNTYWYRCGKNIRRWQDE